MLLIHGYPLNSGLFRDNVAALSAEYQVVTVDLRGFGRSRTPNREGSVRLDATDTLAVMDELGLDRAIVAGTSTGGTTAPERYRQAPERFAGLVLSGTAEHPAGTAEAGLRNGAAAQAQEPDGLATLGAYFTPDTLTGVARTGRPEPVKHLDTPVGQASVGGAVGGGVALATRPDSIGTMATTTVPALILVGQEDSLTPVEVAQEMQVGILNAELVILPGAVNAAILEWAAGLPWSLRTVCEAGRNAVALFARLQVACTVGPSRQLHEPSCSGAEARTPRRDTERVRTFRRADGCASGTRMQAAPTAPPQPRATGKLEPVAEATGPAPKRPRRKCYVAPRHVAPYAFSRPVSIR